MKENKTSEKLKHFAKKKWGSFIDWFTDKEHPHSRLNKVVFFHDLLKLVGLILVFLIIYSNVDKINQIVLIFIKLGSLLQLVLLFFILRKSWDLTTNLKYAFRGLNHGTKAIIAILIVLLLFMAFLNQDKVVNSIIQTYEEANFSKLNPVQISGNFSLGDFSFSNSGLGIKEVSIIEMMNNKKQYLNKEVVIESGIYIDVMCALNDCCDKLNDKNLVSGYMLEERKEIVPIKKAKVYVNIPGTAPLGGKWRCTGKLKSLNISEDWYGNKLDKEKTCYYFNASHCECASDYCG